MARLLAILASVIVISVGILMILGLVVGDDLGLLSTIVSAFAVRTLTDVFLQLAVMTAALAVLIGVLNLLLVHLTRIRDRRRGWGYSIVLVLVMLAVVALYMLERAGLLTGSPAITAVLFETVQVSMESALAGLVLFALVFGAFRMLRGRVTAGRLLFVLALLFVLVAALPLPGFGALANIRDWVLAVPVSAGARGILLGIALAATVTGVRVLIGLDRSYRE